MGESITRSQLSNGLTVLLKEIHTSPIVSQWVWYRVGSRDEVPGKTGLSHWCEHMLFKGTPQYPSGELDRLISRSGGYWNALTFMDWTTYFESMPSDSLDLVLNLEADRMVNISFEPDEVASERMVVISERQGEENEPLFRLSEEVHAAAFRVHSYHHEVIGDLVDLQNLQPADLYQHYQTYYQPGNSVLTLAGDFNSEQVLARIQDLYANLPANAGVPHLKRPEPPQTGERRITVEGPGETTYIQISYRAPAGSDLEFFPYTVLDSLLTGPSNLNMFGGGISNKTSRLYQALVEKELAVSVYGGLSATIDPYLYTINITVHPSSTVEQCLLALEAEINRLQESPPPKAELERAVKQARALFAYGSESISNQAFWLGFSEMFASYDWFLGYVDQLASVTVEDVQSIAQTRLRPQVRTLGVYLPVN
jgi:zinc protease